MQSSNIKQLQLKKLYNLLEKIDANILASDYKMRCELTDMRKQVVDKIKAIQSNVVDSIDVVVK